MKVNRAFIFLARREFFESIKSKHTLFLLGAYVALAIVYGVGAYINYTTAFQPLPGGITGITFDGSSIVPNEWLLGNVDLVSTLGALFALAFSFGSISSERVTKSFFLLSSYPVKRVSIIGGKILAISLVFIPIGALLPVVSIALSFASLGHLTGDMLLRVEALGGMNALYLLFWISFGVLISAVTSRPGNSLAICAMVWLALQERFLGFGVSLIVQALLWPGLPYSSVPQSSLTAILSSVGSTIPPYHFLHAVYGSYNSAGLMTSTNPLSGSLYILGQSNSFAKWFAFALPDVLVLAGSVLFLILLASALLSRSGKS